MNSGKVKDKSSIGGAFSGAAENSGAEQQAVKMNVRSHVFIQVGEPSNGLSGYTELCAVTPKSCETEKGADKEVVVFDEEIQQQMLRVNIYANADIKGVSDDENYNNPELWKSPEPVEGKGLLGDCEDYVLHKMEKLQQEGFPRAAMSIVHVITPEGEGHAVLAVHTDKGDYILDNLENEILLPHETGYTFVQIEGKDGWNKAALSDDKRGPAFEEDEIGNLINRQEKETEIPLPARRPDMEGTEGKIPIPTWRPDR